MKNYGLSLLIIGAITSLSAVLFINTALPGTEVINFGRVQLQQFLFQAGSVMFVAGAIFTSAGHVAEAIAPRGDTDGPRMPVPIVGISAAIGGTIAAMMFAFGSGGGVTTSEAPVDPASISTENASALADRMEAEADRLDAEANRVERQR